MSTATAMKIREKLRSNWQTRSASWHPSSGDPELVRLLGGFQPTKSGAVVTPDTSMRVSTVFACVRLAQRTISTLPKGLFRKLGGKQSEPAPNHPVHTLIKKRPNPFMTSSQFFTALQGHLELRGNAYAYIQWGPSGHPTALWPWHPDRVEVTHDGLKPTYRFRAKDGTQTVRSENVLHVREFTMDGFTGLSPIAYARESIGLGMTAEEYGARYFTQGQHARGFISHPSRLEPDDRAALQTGLKKYAGMEEAHNFFILWDGGMYHPIGIAPEEMQFLETRQFGAIDICRFFGFHPHMIGAGAESADNKTEQLGIQFLVHSIQPRAVNWEESLTQALLLPHEQDEYFVSLNLDGVARGDMKSRYEAHGLAIDKGWKNRNEVRELENMSPVDGLDEFMEPMNMGPLGVQEAPIDPAKAKPKSPAKVAVKAKRGHTRPAERSNVERRANGRKVLRESFFPLFRDAAERLVKREVREIRKRLAEIRKRGRGGDGSVELRDAATDFQSWIDTFYSEFEGQLRDGFAPAVNALADAVALNAMQEIDADDPADVSEMTDAYLDGLAKRHTGSSKGQLRQLLESDDFQEKIEERLAEWLDKRADKEAARETTQLEGAIARNAMRQMGVTKFVWRNAGTETCPICKELEGRQVGGDEPFARAGDLINPNKSGQDRDDDEAISLKLYHNIFHPPLHDGCDCLLLPVF